jgi:rod shape-determining protein MreB
MEIRGRNLNDGLPGSVEITSGDIRHVLSEPVNTIISAIKETLEVTLPELSADIIDRGIYLTGSASQLRGLKELIEQETNIPVIVPENPTQCVALGTSIKLRRAK